MSKISLHQLPIIERDKIVELVTEAEERAAVAKAKRKSRFLNISGGFFNCALVFGVIGLALLGGCAKRGEASFYDIPPQSGLTVEEIIRERAAFDAGREHEARFGNDAYIRLNGKY